MIDHPFINALLKADQGELRKLAWNCTQEEWDVFKTYKAAVEIVYPIYYEKQKESLDFFEKWYLNSKILGIDAGKLVEMINQIKND